MDTQWNKNFNSDYILPIQIINSKTAKPLQEEPEKELKETIKAAFYPES